MTEDSEWLVGLLAKSLGIGGSAAMLLVVVAVVIVKMARRSGYRLKTRFATVGYKRDAEKIPRHDREIRELKKLSWTAGSNLGCSFQERQATQVTC